MRRGENCSFLLVSAITETFNAETVQEILGGDHYLALGGGIFCFVQTSISREFFISGELERIVS